MPPSSSKHEVYQPMHGVITKRVTELNFPAIKISNHTLDVADANLLQINR